MQIFASTLVKFAKNVPYFTFRPILPHPYCAAPPLLAGSAGPGVSPLVLAQLPKPNQPLCQAPPTAHMSAYHYTIGILT